MYIIMMNYFLTRVILVCCTCFGLLISSLSAQEKIGAQLYSFRKQMPEDVPGTLARIKAMGISELEGGGLYGLTADAFKELLRDNGLTMVGVGAEFNELDSNVQAAVDRAKLFNVKYVTCYWIPHNGSDFGIADAKKAIAVFSKAGKALRENGISLCYHPHGYEFRPYQGGTLFDYMVKNIDKLNANFELDVFWAKHGGADPAALMKKYPDRFPLLHLKDRRKGTPGNNTGEADVETNVVLGDGDVNIAAVMEQAKKIGVKHYLIEDESSRCMEQVPESVKYLRSLE